MRHAVLIASATFDPDSGIEPLRFPANDVAALEVLFKTEDFKFDRITCIIDQPRQFIVETLDEILSGSAFDDFLLIYFSGHGKLNRVGDLFLSCRNTKEKTLNGTGLKYSHMMEMLEAHQADRVAILLDCCYAGRAVSGFRGSASEQITSQLDSGRGIFVLGASGATQTAEEREIDGNGVFTKQVIEGLRTGSADIDGDGQISLNDLAKYVRDEFRRKNVRQDPFTAGLSKSGDLILGVNRKLGHKKVVSSIRVKMEQTRSFFVKSTHRAIEDYLDEVSDNPDAGEDPRFKALAAFAAGASMEDVVVAFRGKSEPGPGPERRPEPKTKPEPYVISGIAAKTFAFVQHDDTEPQAGSNCWLRYIVSGLLLSWVIYFGWELFLNGRNAPGMYDKPVIVYISAVLLYPLTAVLVVGTLRGYDWARSLGRWLVCLGLAYIIYNGRGTGVADDGLFASPGQAYSFIAYGFCVWLLAGYLYFRWPKVTFLGLDGASRLRTFGNISITIVSGCITAYVVFVSILIYPSSQYDFVDMGFMLFLASMLAYVPISKWWRFWKQRRAA